MEQIRRKGLPVTAVLEKGGTYSKNRQMVAAGQQQYSLILTKTDAWQGHLQENSWVFGVCQCAV